MRKTAKFQSFEEQSSPDQGPKRLTALRKELKAQGLAGFLIPRTDMYQGENVAPGDERLAWLTGFTGSAGFCVALLKTAGVFVDGRYRVQVKNQIKVRGMIKILRVNTLQMKNPLENLSLNLIKR